MWMSVRLMQAAAILFLAACGSAPTKSSAQEGPSDRPFRVSEVTRFDAPWAMDFLPGSGLPITNMALVTEKGGRLWLVDVANGKKQAVRGVPRVQVAGQ